MRIIVSTIAPLLFVTGAAQTSLADGKYLLYMKHSSIATNVMFIEMIDETTFEIRGTNWKGNGKIKNNRGFYDFEFENGDYGRTDFRINKKDELIGNVRFDKNNLIWVDMDWSYVAKKEK